MRSLTRRTGVLGGLQRACDVKRYAPLIMTLVLALSGERAEAQTGDFGIDSQGHLVHIDEGWSAGFNYLCVNNVCYSGTISAGYFRRNVASEVAVGQTVDIEFKVEDNGGQCLTGSLSITRGSGDVFISSPCASGGAPPPPPNPAPPPNPPPAPPPSGASLPDGAGLVEVNGTTITTRFAERFRDRHESDRNHDSYITEYAEGSSYEIVLIDRPNSLEVQIHSPHTPLSMVNFTHTHIVNPGFADPPQYTGGGFMRKGSLSGPADDSATNLVNSLYYEMTSANGRPWSTVRSSQEIVTLEFTPRRPLNGNFPQYYSDIIRYRAGQGGITFERDDARYFSAGPTTNFAHGSVGFEFSQAFVGIDEPLLETFLLGRELFRASFLGESLPGNGGTATGADPAAVEDACINCHFQLGKGAPPGRATSLEQGFINGGADLRVAPQLIGLGLLEAVDPSTIQGFATQNGGKVGLGRFGWKSTEPTIRAQILKAFDVDMGVTNPPTVFVDRIEAYIRALGVPIRRHPTAQANQQPNVALRVPDGQTITDSDILDGEAAFNDSGCATCHIPEMRTGTRTPIPQFRDIVIRPFTDLLLWDMGPGLCSSSGEGNASACEWRTAPLWGTRLQERVTGHRTFLHDGRATTRDAAIRAHGGSAAAARVAYENLPAHRRSHLILYLRSL